MNIILQPQPLQSAETRYICSRLSAVELGIILTATHQLLTENLGLIYSCSSNQYSTLYTQNWAIVASALTSFLTKVKGICIFKGTNVKTWSSFCRRRSAFKIKHVHCCMHNIRTNVKR
jgi:hypothetical protein